jgi:hypothetical protein
MPPLASPAQEQFWLATQGAVKPEAYNLAAAVHLDGPLDAGLLALALQRLVDWQPALRTTFRFDDGRLLRCIAPSLAFDVPLDVLPAGASLGKLLREFAAAPFDLTRGPLLRARLLRLDRSRHVLAMACQHSILDGWSLGVLLPALGRVYGALLDGGQVALPPAARELGAGSDSDLDYWRAALAGAPRRIVLPGAREHGGWRAEQASVGLDGAPRFSLLAAALYTALRDASGTADLAIGTVAANRGWRERRVVGCLASPLPLRLALPSGAEAAEVLARTEAAVRGLREHQATPLRAIVRAAKPARSVGGSPLFNVALVHHNFPGARRLAGWQFATGIRARLELVPTGAAQLDLSFVALPGEAGMRLTCEYRVDLFPAALIGGLLEAVRQAVARLQAVYGRSD